MIAMPSTFPSNQNKESHLSSAMDISVEVLRIQLSLLGRAKSVDNTEFEVQGKGVCK